MRRLRQGASAIEFALCMLVFTPLLFSLLEFGWYFYQHANVSSAVRFGIRGAVILPQEGDCVPPTAATDEVKRQLRLYGYSEDAVGDADITQACSGSSPEETLVVSASVPYVSIIGLLPVPDAIDIQMAMILELQD